MSAVVIAAAIAVVVPIAVASGASSLPSVHALSARAVDGPGVKLSWRWPASDSVTSVTVRYARGTHAPRASSAGDRGGVVRRGRHSVTVYDLLPNSKYSFGVFSRGHRRTGTADTVTIKTGDVPMITSTSLPSGVVGTSYDAALSVSDSASGHWSISSGALPDGLALSGAHITGTPTAAGSSSFVLSYVDAHGVTSYAGEAITVDAPTPTPSPTPTPTTSTTPSPSPTTTP